MGEKGNITAEELAGAAQSAQEAGGLGAVVAGAGTTVTAVFSDTTDKLQDKLVDKGLDAGIGSVQERLRGEKDPGDSSGTPDPAPDPGK